MRSLALDKRRRDVRPENLATARLSRYFDSRPRNDPEQDEFHDGLQKVEPNQDLWEGAAIVALPCGGRRSVQRGVVPGRVTDLGCAPRWKTPYAATLLSRLAGC